VALGRTGAKLRRGAGMDELRLSVELCAAYWHFLLGAWVVLFSLLAYAPSFVWLYAICTASLG
jgi:cytochrome c oxidase subunit 3